MTTPTPPPQGPTSPPLSSYHSQSTFQQQHIPSSQITTTNSSATETAPNEASTKLAEAIDDFLGDLETKFKGISDEILTKLDDMAERCDRLEQEMLVRETSGGALDGGNLNGKGSIAGSG